jgi:hypothetical protein
MAKHDAFPGEGGHAFRTAMRDGTQHPVRNLQGATWSVSGLVETYDSAHTCVD